MDEKVPIDTSKADPFDSLDSRKLSVNEVAVESVPILEDADEALAFLENHPNKRQIAEEGAAILADPVRLKEACPKDRSHHHPFGVSQAGAMTYYVY